MDVLPVSQLGMPVKTPQLVVHGARNSGSWFRPAGHEAEVATVG